MTPDGRESPKAGPAPDISVVIPHYDDLVRLAVCAAALAPQADDRIEVVVADNGTPGGVGDALAPLPRARVITVDDRGAAPARTAGAAATTAPVIAFLDADCRPLPDWIAAIRAAVAGHGMDRGRAVVLGGKIGVYDEAAADPAAEGRGGGRTGSQAFETVFAFDQDGYVNRKGFAVTANLVVPRPVWDATGPFRPGLSEDVDWCQRAVRGGARLVYAPEIAVEHPTRSDWAALTKKWRRLTDEEYGLWGRDRPLRWRAKALAMPASVIAHIPRMLLTPGLTPAEKGRGIATLARLRLARMGWMLGQGGKDRK